MPDQSWQDTGNGAKNLSRDEENKKRESVKKQGILHKALKSLSHKSCDKVPFSVTHVMIFVKEPENRDYLCSCEYKIKQL